MDLSSSRPIAAGAATLSSADMASLVAALAGPRSATALAQAALDAPPLEPAPSSLLSPVSGAFNDAMAARLTAWKRS